MVKYSFKEKVIVITGASSGIWVDRITLKAVSKKK